jgi:RNA polymerase sigma-70 factor (ECF subfamily)
MEQTDHEVRALVEGSTRGDAESAKILYEHLVDKVFPFVRSRTATKEEALDTTQDVFIDFFGALPRFTFQSSAQLYAYVFVITRRKLAKHYGAFSQRKGQEVFDEEYMSPPESPQDDVVMRHSLMQALQTLDEKTQEIVVLHHWSRYTFGEIAEMLTMTESAVRVAHHRALKKIRPQVESLKHSI